MNPNENRTTPARKRKHYDEAFQRTAVEPWLLSGQSARATAAELGLTTQTLQRSSKGPARRPGGRRAENRRLHRMVPPRNILKKPWA